MTLEVLSPRAEMGAVARRAKAGVVIFTEIDSNFTAKSSEAKKMAEETKVEFYGLMAVITDNTVSRAINNKQYWPPYGVLHHEKVSTPFEGAEEARFDYFSKSMGATLDSALTQELDFLEIMAKGLPDSPEGKIHRRVSQLVDLYAKADGESHTVRTFVRRGVYTATRVMKGMLDLIPAMCEDRWGGAEPEELLEIAKNSYPLIRQIASMDIYSLNRIIDQTSGDAGFGFFFSSEEFELRRTPMGWALFLKEEERKWTEDDETELKKFVTRGEQEVGCPALVNFGEGSAIKRLWKWHLEYAKDAYEQMDAEVVEDFF